MNNNFTCQSEKTADCVDLNQKIVKPVPPMPPYPTYVKPSKRDMSIFKILTIVLCVFLAVALLIGGGLFGFLSLMNHSRTGPNSSTVQRPAPPQDGPPFAYGNSAPWHGGNIDLSNDPMVNAVNHAFHSVVAISVSRWRPVYIGIAATVNTAPTAAASGKAVNQLL